MTYTMGQHRSIWTFGEQVMMALHSLPNGSSTITSRSNSPMIWIQCVRNRKGAFLMLFSLKTIYSKLLNYRKLCPICNARSKTM